MIPAKVKRRPLRGRRFGGGCDAQTSQTLATDYRDPARQNQGGPLSEDGQPVSGRVDLPRSDVAVIIKRLALIDKNASPQRRYRGVCRTLLLKRVI